MPPVAAVTFDLWQTLILDTPEVGRPRGERRLADTLAILHREGFACTTEQLQVAFRACLARLDVVRYQGDDFTFEEQVDLFLSGIEGVALERLGVAVRGELATRYADCYLDHPPAIDAHAASVLRAMREMNLKVALICNTGATPGSTQRRFLEQAGLSQYFDLLVFSDEERASKPAPRIFAATLERIGATAAETVHIGDHPRNDVLGAKQAGLRAIWLRRKDEPYEVEPDARVDSLDGVPEALRLLRQ